jgi:hypothetical protein
MYRIRILKRNENKAIFKTKYYQTDEQFNKWYPRHIKTYGEYYDIYPSILIEGDWEPLEDPE